VAFDVTHIYAWVRENNPRVYVEGPCDVTYIPTGDPDCRLGVKKSSNQEQPDGSTIEKKERLFGYGSGIATCTDAVYGDVILAEYTQPFNEGDVTYFTTLYIRTVATLGFFPTHLTADAAFDAWYIYETVARRGIAAIPLNRHGHPESPRDADGTPLCERGLRMHPTYQFSHTYGYGSQRLRCPLLFPQPSGQRCDHAQFRKQKGCVQDAKGPQLGTRGKDARAAGSPGAALPEYLSPTHQYRARQQPIQGRRLGAAQGAQHPLGAQSQHAHLSRHQCTRLAAGAHAQCLRVHHAAGQGGLNGAFLHQGKQTPLTLLCGRSGG
jgi:hypothetical protein